MKSDEGSIPVQRGRAYQEITHSWTLSRCVCRPPDPQKGAALSSFGTHRRLCASRSSDRRGKIEELGAQGQRRALTGAKQGSSAL